MCKFFSVFATTALLAVLAGASLHNVASAQSFSCANAQIPSEMAVCNNERLLIKDETVASLLASKLVEATQSGQSLAVSRDHTRWLKDRNACQNDMSCLEQEYDRRIEVLNGRDP